jgi:type IV pilus biogenesis/stability protein PilW
MITRRQMMKRLVLILFLMIISSCATTPPGADNIQKAKAHYELGISRMNDENIQPAFVEFQKALELNPDYKEAHNAIGVIYLQKLDDYSNAVKHFKEALRVDPEFSEASNNLGTAYADMGKYKEAAEAYKRALSNPQYRNPALALYNLGMIYYELARYDDAINAFQEALRRFADLYQPYYGLALCYNAKGRYSDASSAIMNAIRLDPLYKGDKAKAKEDLKNRKLTAKGNQEKDISDFLDILNY